MQNPDMSVGIALKVKGTNKCHQFLQEGCKRCHKNHLTVTRIGILLLLLLLARVMDIDLPIHMYIFIWGKTNKQNQRVTNLPCLKNFVFIGSPTSTKVPGVPLYHPC